MQPQQTTSVVLVVSSEPMVAERVVEDLRGFGQVAVPIDCCEVALEIMDVVDCALIIVDVENPDDWRICSRLAESGRTRVAIMTRFLAEDRRFRRAAFEMGVTAYACKPCTRACLEEMLDRLRNGERWIEIVTGASYRVS